MLAKNVNDNAVLLNKRGALKFFASGLVLTDLWRFAALLPVGAPAWLYSTRSAWSAHQESSCSPPYNCYPQRARTSGV